MSIIASLVSDSPGQSTKTTFLSGERSYAETLFVTDFVLQKAYKPRCYCFKLPSISKVVQPYPCYS